MPVPILPPLRLDLDAIEAGFDGTEPWWAKHLVRELRERRASARDPQTRELIGLFERLSAAHRDIVLDLARKLCARQARDIDTGALSPASVGPRAERPAPL